MVQLPLGSVSACMHACVFGSGNSFGNVSRNCCLTLCGKIPRKRFDISIDRDRSLIYRCILPIYYMFPVLSRPFLALFMSCLSLVHRFCIYLLRLSFRFFCFASFVVLESALPHILHTLLPSYSYLVCCFVTIAVKLCLHTHKHMHTHTHTPLHMYYMGTWLWLPYVQRS